MAKRWSKRAINAALGAVKTLMSIEFDNGKAVWPEGVRGRVHGGDGRWTVRAKVKPEDLTDEMIRAEWAAALDRGDRAGAQVTQVALGLWNGSHRWTASDRDYTPACAICSGLPKDMNHIDAAREILCQSINARAGKEG